MSIIQEYKCTYITPCGYCTRFDKWCEYNETIKNTKSNVDVDIDNEEWKEVARWSLGT